MKKFPFDFQYPPGLSFGIAFLWQFIPAICLMWKLWDSPSMLTWILFSVVFLIVPLLSGLVHRSWEIGIAAFLLPILSVIAMFVIYIFIIPTGKW